MERMRALYQLPTSVLPILSLLTASVGAYYAAYTWFGARIPAGDGLGWDGQLYAAYAQDFFGVLSRQGVSHYHASRLLPSFIVWSASKILGIDLNTPDKIIAAFHLYNGALLIGVGLIWTSIASTCKLSLSIGLIGLASLFINWAVLKQYGVYGCADGRDSAIFGHADCIGRHRAALDTAYSNGSDRSVVLEFGVPAVRAFRSISAPGACNS